MSGITHLATGTAKHFSYLLLNIIRPIFSEWSNDLIKHLEVEENPQNKKTHNNK